MTSAGRVHGPHQATRTPRGWERPTSKEIYNGE
jgi:hypothetical protein